MSGREFLPQGEMLTLRVGSQEFKLSHYPSTGETTRVIFSLTSQEFAQVNQGDSVFVDYGSGASRWNFGKVDKSLLNR